jgi:hypothetical protein
VIDRALRDGVEHAQAPKHGPDLARRTFRHVALRIWLLLDGRVQIIATFD